MIRVLLNSRPAAVVVILIASIGVYLNALPGEFVYDDPTLIEQNPWITAVGHLPDIFLSNAWAFEQMQSNYYRPLLFVILMLDFHLFGLESWGYHLSNVLLHAGVSVLVFMVAASLLKQGHRLMDEPSASSWQRLLPLIAALLFALHPIHTESVAWISGMTDVSFSLFYLLAFHLYMKAEGRWCASFAGSLLCFFLAALCKEPALTLPIMLFIYDALIRREGDLSADGILSMLKRYGPFAFVAIAYLALRTYSLGEFAPVQRHQALSSYEYFINIFPLFGQYLGKLVFPIDLNVLHVFHPISSLISWPGLAGALTTLSFLGAVYFLARRDRVAAFCLLWIAIPLLPALYIPALGENSFAERYLYLPSFGFVMFVSIALVRMATARRRFIASLALPCLMIVGVAYAFATVERNLDWRDNFSLWADTIQHSPDAYIAYNNLGLAHINRNEPDQAVAILEEALRLNPAYAKSHYNLGLVFEKRGQLAVAAVQFERAVALDSRFAKASHNLGAVRSRQGLYGRAIEAYVEALRIRPDFVQAHHDLGAAYAAVGKLDMAIDQYHQALNLAPDFAEAFFGLGNAHGKKGMLEISADQFARAIELKPDYAEAHHNLGVIHAKQGKFEQAAKEYEAALSIKPGYAQAYHSLGALLASQGLFSQAARQWEEALRLSPDRVDTRYNLGIAYLKMSKLSMAKKSFEQVLAKQPSHAGARQAMANLNAPSALMNK